MFYSLTTEYLTPCLHSVILTDPHLVDRAQDSNARLLSLPSFAWVTDYILLACGMPKYSGTSLYVNQLPESN